MNIIPAFEYNNISIVCASDDNYVPYLSTLLISMLENISSEFNYDIWVLSDGIQIDKKRELLKLLEGKPNVSLRFMDIECSDAFPIDEFFISNRKKWSRAIFFRMYIPYTFTAYKKMIYMDCDIINKYDIAMLYNVDIADYAIGVPRLLGMVSTNGMRNYVCQRVWKEMSGINMEEYFNSGVLLLNLDEMRHLCTREEINDYLKNQSFALPDQDSLNVLFYGKVKFIDAGWNYYPYTESEFKRALYLCPEYLKSYFEQGYKNIKNIHYTTTVKPWRKLGGRESCFWNIAVKSPYIEEIKRQREKYMIYEHIKAKQRKTKLLDLIHQSKVNKLYLYGFGERGRNFYEKYFDTIDFSGIIDRDNSIKVTGFELITPDSLKWLNKESVILVSNDNYRPIVDNLINYGFRNIFVLRLIYDSKNIFIEDDFDKYKKFLMLNNMLADIDSKRILRQIIELRKQHYYDENIRFFEIYSKDGWFPADIFSFIENEVYYDVSEDGDYWIEQCLDILGNKKCVVERIKEAVEMKEIPSFIRIDKINALEIISNPHMVSIINKYSPKMAINISKNKSDLFDIPLLVKKINSSYKLFIRHHSEDEFMTILYAAV